MHTKLLIATVQKGGLGIDVYFELWAWMLRYTTKRTARSFVKYPVFSLLYIFLRLQTTLQVKLKICDVQ